MSIPLFLLLLQLLTASAATSYSSSTTLTSFTTRTIQFLPLPTASIPKIPNNRTIVITNNCSDTLWPGLLSTNGTPPWTQGFELPGKHSQKVWVGWDWVGRIWGRTNCSFGEDDKSDTGTCRTGDCGGKLDCVGKAGQPPMTLAEFTITGFKELSYYDISLVDGYNLDVEIIPEARPVGVDPADLSPKSTHKKDSRWCPWDLQQSPPSKGPYNPYFWQPDDHIQRPFFDPCLSACAAWGKPSDCCTGKYDTPQSCKPSLYSNKAKSVCKDAYSYAYDDKLSTFTVPTGQGFEVVFCPGGDSTNIMERTNNSSKSSASSSNIYMSQREKKKVGMLMAAVMVIVAYEFGYGIMV